MSPIVSTANLVLSLATIVGQGIVLVLILNLLVYRGRGPFFEIIGKYGLLFSFIVAATATLGSLFYSEIAGFEPCKLCWFQRIFMYPQSILLGMAFWKKDKNIVNYGIVLSGLGALIALYHYLLQLGLVPSIDCSAIGYSVSCSQRFVMNFGYITIPMMSLTAFLMIFFFLITYKIVNKNSTETLSTEHEF